jgi:hypothetical protein
MGLNHRPFFTYFLLLLVLDGGDDALCDVAFLLLARPFQKGGHSFGGEAFAFGSGDAFGFGCSVGVHYVLD